MDAQLCHRDGTTVNVSKSRCDFIFTGTHHDRPEVPTPRIFKLPLPVAVAAVSEVQGVRFRIQDSAALNTLIILFVPLPCRDGRAGFL